MSKDLYKESFTEEDIRSSVFETDKQKAYEEDVQWLLKRRNQFVDVGCPACGSSEHESFFEKKSFTYVKCVECRTVFMNSRPSAELTQEFY